MGGRAPYNSQMINPTGNLIICMLYGAFNYGTPCTMGKCRTNKILLADGFRYLGGEFLCWMLLGRRRTFYYSGKLLDKRWRGGGEGKGPHFEHHCSNVPN